MYNDKDINLLRISLLIFVILTIAYLTVTTHQINNTRKDLTYTVCNLARTTAAVTEDECGRLQDEYKLEYMCKYNDPYPTNNCWIEEK